MTTPRPGGGWRQRLPTVHPSMVQRLALITLISVSGIVLTGAAVRVTGSGLGCADWPACTKTHITPAFTYHPMIEFGNRLVTIVLIVLIGLAFLAAARRRPFRRDLFWLSGSLVFAVFVEAVIGGLLVYSKLNPYLLVVHFLATLGMLAAAAVFHYRSGRDYSPGSGRLLVPRPILHLSRGLVLFTAVVITAGAATTGTAPDAGGAQGQLVARRIPVPLRSMAELHATLALFLVGAVISLAVALHAMDVPERIRKGARMLVVALVFQAAIGYAQYFAHLPAGLVELHELGVTIIVIGVVHYFFSLTQHPHERFAEGTLASSRADGAEREGAPAALAHHAMSRATAADRS